LTASYHHTKIRTLSPVALFTKLASTRSTSRPLLKLSSSLPCFPTSQSALHRGNILARPLSTNMANDNDYMAFLGKANQDLDDGKALAGEQAEARSKASFKTLDEGSQAPKVIRDACGDAVYVTEADEPFEEVSLKWTGDGLPDESEFQPVFFAALGRA
jgi:hypothetical protein